MKLRILCSHSHAYDAHSNKNKITLHTAHVAHTQKCEAHTALSGRLRRRLALRYVLHGGSGVLARSWCVRAGDENVRPHLSAKTEEDKRLLSTPLVCTYAHMRKGMFWWPVYASLTKNKVAVHQNTDGYVFNNFVYVPSVHLSSTPSSKN